MAPLFAFVASVFVLGLLSERAILAWSRGGGVASPGEPVRGPEMRPFALQMPPWRALVARSSAVLMVGLVAVAFARFDDVGTAIRVSVIAAALVACSATDLLSFRVPDAVTLPAIAFALATSFALSEPAPVSAIVGGVLAGGFLLTATLVTRGGLGGGDIKLGVLAGVALGLPLVFIALGIGIVAGSLSVIALNLAGVLEREQGFTFAPFLALPVVVALFVM